jgi:hypothetical protein
VSRVGSDTALARIIRLVEQAQARRAPIQGLADRVAGRFCYGVMALALATFLFWWLFGASHWPQVLQAAAPGLPHAHGMAHGHGSWRSVPSQWFRQWCHHANWLGAPTHHCGACGGMSPVRWAWQLPP